MMKFTTVIEINHFIQLNRVITEKSIVSLLKIVISMMGCLILQISLMQCISTQKTTIMS